MSNFLNGDNTHTKMIGVKPVHISKKKDYDAVPNEDIDTLKEDAYAELKHMQNNIADLKEEQDKQIEEMNKVIQEERAAWDSEKEQLIEQAQYQGYTDGFQKGEKESQEKYRQLLEDANRIVEKCQTDYHTTIEKSTDAILELGIKTAEKLLHQELKYDPDAFNNIVHHVIKELKNQSIITIHLSVANYEHVLKQKEELINIVGPDTTLSLQLMEDMKPNHCLIEHPSGQIDAGIDTQLKQVRKALQEYRMEQS